MVNWVILLYSGNQHNIVIQLFFSETIKIYINEYGNKASKRKKS